MDKRKFPRKEVILEVELGYQTGDIQVVHTRDISDGGLFVILEDVNKPVIGEVVNVKLVGESAGLEVFPSAEAIVVRHEQSGIGLAFIEMDFVGE
ncbi:MAG: PilZ domain-containing protein [Gammaproteobacteria bacterium]|nr:PilZ domain-containing protein [Gammaproteobacteria bacterium]